MHLILSLAFVLSAVLSVYSQCTLTPVTVHIHFFPLSFSSFFFLRGKPKHDPDHLKTSGVHFDPLELAHSRNGRLIADHGHHMMIAP